MTTEEHAEELDQYAQRGHVEPDGRGIERVDGPLRVRRLSVEEMGNDVHVRACARTGAALLLDVAARPDRLCAAVADLDLVAAAHTHGHWDHVRAWEDLVEDEGCERPHLFTGDSLFGLGFGSLLLASGVASLAGCILLDSRRVPRSAGPGPYPRNAALDVRTTAQTPV